MVTELEEKRRKVTNTAQRERLLQQINEAKWVGWRIGSLMQKRHKSIASALELGLFSINSLRPSDAYMRL